VLVYARIKPVTAKTAVDRNIIEQTTFMCRNNRAVKVKIGYVSLLHCKAYIS